MERDSPCLPPSENGLCSPVVSEASPEPAKARGGSDFISIIRGRRNMVTGAERMLLEYAAVQVYRHTLFTDPFPSAPDLTGSIHQAWEDAERHHLTNIEASAESLALVRARKIS